MRLADTAWILPALCLVASCASHPRPEPTIQVHEAQVPVAVKCAADPGPEPAYADTSAALTAAPDIFARVQLLLAGREQRIARLLEVTAANAACR